MLETDTMQPTRTLAIALGAASGLASALSCWLVIFRLEAPSGMGGTVRYLPGAILGGFICIEGQAILGWPRVSVARLGALILVTTLAWRLSQWAHALGGPLQWLIASLLGALGTCAGMMLAWPLRAIRRLLLMTATMIGLGGGVLFTLASTLHLYSLRLYGSAQLWPFILMCMWHCALLTAAGICLHRARSASR